MLILNGKLFDPASQAEDNMKVARDHYHECVQSLKDKFGRYGYVKVTRRRGLQINPSGLAEPVPMVIFPARTYLNVQFSTKISTKERDSGGGMETWAISFDPPSKKDGDYIAEPHSIKINSLDKVLFLNEDMEEIYFLLYKSPIVSYPEATAKYGKRTGGEFVVDNKDEREQLIAEGRKASASLNHAIYGDATSPLYDESALRAAAAAWGVEGALSETATADEVRNMLYADVERKQKVKEAGTNDSKGVSDFLEFLNFDDIIRARAIIIEAIDRKIVVYNMVKSTYVYEVTGVPLLIVPEKAKHRKFDYLADFLLANTNTVAWEKFRRECINTEYLKTKDYGFLRWLSKLDDIPASVKSEVDLRKALSEKYV